MIQFRCNVPVWKYVEYFIPHSVSKIVQLTYTSCWNSYIRDITEPRVADEKEQLFCH